MKQKISKWAFRIIVTMLFIAGILFVIILNPILTYANKTVHNQYTVYHHKALNAEILIKLDQASTLLKSSELYNPELHLDICLNDGSKYPKLIQILRGNAFGWGFYNKVVLQGNIHNNYVELNGYKWNLTQLLAHEMTHCLQFNSLGLWKSKPISAIPNWKWEGYAEFISRQNEDQKDLSVNIERLLACHKKSWEISFTDNSIAPREYYEYWLLVQYCMNIKKMTFQQLLKDTASEQTIRQEMMNWQLGNK
jgi:hypothetical protein